MLDRKLHVASVRAFFLWLFLLLSLAVGHSVWATSLDGFTIDEPYHVAAGASYVRWGDYRLNPEHPPLVKLIAGLAASPKVLHLTPLRLLSEKQQERDYTQKAVFLDSDSALIQRRARASMLAFNALLLSALTLVLARIFGSDIALVSLLLLALDPTVSAHMPVVMTDLPMALLGAICLCLMILALRDRHWRDWIFLGVATGLLLATKHSAPLIALPMLLGCTAFICWQAARKQFARRQLLGLIAACALSMAVLWATYGFHYRETPGSSAETFNRPLAAKINDLHSLPLRNALDVAQTLRLVPRAYLWGLADTLRAGVEGRPFWIQAMGVSYQGKAPWWVPFADLAVKLPLAFLLLAISGLAFLVMGRFAPEVRAPLAALLAMIFFFMLFIAHNGIFYAGLRHWLFVVPLLAILAAVTASSMLTSSTVWWRITAIGTVAWIAIAVLPERRIWEYHNALAGGSQNAWQSFSNESVDLGRRTPEFIAFYKSHIAPAPVMIDYWKLPELLQADSEKPWQPQPEEIGNLLLFHGNFHLPRLAAGILEFRALSTIHQVGSDQRLIEQYLQRSIKLDPELTAAAIELGNFALLRQDNQRALQWYELARKDAAAEPDILPDLDRQIQRVQSAPAGTPVRIMRNPAQE